MGEWKEREGGRGSRKGVKGRKAERKGGRAALSTGAGIRKGDWGSPEAEHH